MIIRRTEFYITGLFISATILILLAGSLTVVLMTEQKSKWVIEFARDLQVTSESPGR